MRTQTRWITKILLGITLMTATESLYAQAALPEADAKQIHAALQGMDDAWNRHDMKAYASFLAEDADWVNVVGMWWKGRDQVYRAHKAFHNTIFKTRQLHPPETVSLRLVAPETVIAIVVQRADGFTTPSGHVEPAGRSILTEVFVRRNGRWLVVSAQNTTIVEEAQRSNPIQP